MKIVYLFSFIFFGICCMPANGQIHDAFFNNADTFFKSYVTDGKVDYQAIKANVKELDGLIKAAGDFQITTKDANEYKAFWINAYNISVIKGIIDNYGIKSPLDKDGFFDKIKYDLGGTSITLNDIENKMLRAKFNEPRFHFVLVCGAKGCPPLISEAYKPATVEKLLQQQTVKAMNNPSFTKVSEGKTELSEIFKWYKEDFTKNGQKEVEFINKFRKDKISTSSTISYYPYNWKLNSK